MPGGKNTTCGKTKILRQISARATRGPKGSRGTKKKRRKTGMRRNQKKRELFKGKNANGGDTGQMKQD